MKIIKSFIKLFLPTKEIRFIGVFSLIITIGLIFAPPLLRIATRFDPANYYALISGIIGGIITLFVLLLQYTYENEKRHEENRINARGIFEVNYTKKPNDDNKLKKCIVKTNRTKNNLGSIINYLVIKLHSEKSIIDCHVIFDGIRNDERITCNDIALIGLVVPNQTIVIPISFTYDKTDITILYRTLMGEIIKHKFEFEKGIRNPANNETMYCNRTNELIITDSLDEIINSNDFKIIYVSQSRLFEYFSDTV